MFNDVEFEEEFLDFCQKQGISHEAYDEDDWYELIGTWSDGEYVRVFESFQVHYIPVDILDVTSEFT